MIVGYEVKGIWKLVLLVYCNLINELDFRIFNFSIWTSVDQVMVLLPRSAYKGQQRSACRGQPVEVSRGQLVEISRGQLVEVRC